MKSRSGVPLPSSPEAKRRMENTRQRDTAAERVIRSILFAYGLRYRVDATPIPGLRRRADILFRSSRIAVYVDGCFWHGCPVHATWPKQNADFWKAKIEANRARDADTNQRLKRAGWKVIRIWEHEDPNKAASRIRSALMRGN
jgi:DNA mismatch endonuclease, patch repair protein